MRKQRYDIAVVGGGMGGAAFAAAMAAQGLTVLVMERDTQFRDRVRGEGMHAWGVPEAKTLGIYPSLLADCAIEVRWWDIYLGARLLTRRDFPATTPHGSPLMSFFHPHMQEVLLACAASAGAEVRRGAAVRDVRPGPLPTVTVEHEGWTSEVEARLVVAADGRNSPTRKWAGFTVRQDADERLFTGVLLEKVTTPQDAWLGVMNPGNGQEAVLCPLGDGRVRAYLGYPRVANHKLAKAGDLSRFIDESVRTGTPGEYFRDARMVGPMASFASADSWVERPYRDGVALLGDAASTCDPSFGQGMAMTLRGARLLRDHLLANDDWVQAGAAYADEQHRQFSAVHTLEGWYRQLFLDQGELADARRAVALPRIAEDLSRIPDLFGMGPDAPTDALTRQRFFGEC